MLILDCSDLSDETNNTGLPSLAFWYNNSIATEGLKSTDLPFTLSDHLIVVPVENLPESYVAYTPCI